MKNKWLIGILGALLVLLVACAPAQEAAPAEEAMDDMPEEAAEKEMDGEPIVMGAIFPLSGDGAAYGEPFSRQLMLAVDEVNGNGGIGGKQVEIKLEDGKCTPKDAATAATKLVNVDKVKVIFGGACSGETLGAAPITEEAQVILFSPSATSPDVTEAGDYVFRTAPSDAFAGGVAAEKAIKMGFEKAAIIHETTDYAQGLKSVFEGTFKEKGGEIVMVESFATEEADFKTRILKVKNANPDVVYIVPQTPAKGVLLIKQLREQGVEQPLLTGEVLMGRDVVEENGEAMEGLIGVEPAFDESNPLAKEAMDAYRAEYGEPAFPFFQAATRDAFYLVADTIEAGGYDADAIKEELNAVENWQGAIGEITFDENGDPVLAFSVKQVQNGTLVELE